MQTVAEFLVRGLNLELPENLKRYIEDGLDTTCALTEKPIIQGIPWGRVIPTSTGEYLDLLHGCSLSHLSVEAAKAYKGSWNLGGRLIFEDGTQYHPFIGIKSATDERPCWSHLVRNIWPGRAGQQYMCIIADDYKKRVWPRARVATLGESSLIYLLYGKRALSKNVQVSWPRLIEVLDLVELVYNAGFSKNAIHDGLYTSYSAFSENLEGALDYESSLAEIRHLPEFLVALLIAQKELCEKVQKNDTTE